MAKATLNPYVVEFLELKPVISKIRQVGKSVVFEKPSNCNVTVGYIINDLPWDQFVLLDPEVHCNYLLSHLIIPETYIAYSKYVKKTKTLWSVDDNQNIRFYDQDHDQELILPNAEDLTLVTKDYNQFMRDTEITKLIIDKSIYSLMPLEIQIPSNVIATMSAGESVVIEMNQHRAIISRAIFGRMNKTSELSCSLIREDEDSFVVLFRQKEDGCAIYTAARFFDYFELQDYISA